MPEQVRHSQAEHLKANAPTTLSQHEPGFDSSPPAPSHEFREVGHRDEYGQLTQDLQCRPQRMEPSWSNARGWEDAIGTYRGPKHPASQCRAPIRRSMPPLKPDAFESELDQRGWKDDSRSNAERQALLVQLSSPQGTSHVHIDKFRNSPRPWPSKEQRDRVAWRAEAR